MSQHDYVIANDDGASIRADVNSLAAAIKSGNSDPSSAPSAATQGMYYRKLLSATCQESWEYDGSAWRLYRIIDPTSGKVYPANDRQISGLTLSNNAGDATNDIDIATGNTAADSDGCPLVLTSALTKRLDAAWAVGSNQGGLDTGSIANTTYHMWLIRRPDTGVVDVLFSASASAPTMPTSYTQKRRIGSIVRASGAILGFVQVGDAFSWQTPVGDVWAANPGTSAVTRTLTLPVGIRVEAVGQVGFLSTTTTSAFSALITDLSGNDTAPTVTINSAILQTQGAGTYRSNNRYRCFTNTSAQVRSRLDASDANTTLRMATFGWVDSRGQDA